VLVVPYSERPDLVPRLGEVEDVWPEFIHHTGEAFNALWGRVRREFPELQLVLYDDETDTLVGRGQTIPFRWDGTFDDLPDGVDGVVRRVFEVGGEPTTLSALVAVVDPRYQGRGLSSLVIEGMRRLAGEHGLDALLAPVRPTLKEKHPSTPMEDYLTWRREDGQLFDPWLRVHERLGAEILGVCPGSLVVEGTVAEWEEWTGMSFPDSGSYVVAGALVPVEIDRARDVGSYVEPNVWMRHSVRPSQARDNPPATSPD
jgi:GNAT superfamily N-acetyltransferase